MAASTKKKSATEATTTTHISSSSKPISKAQIQITADGKSKTSYNVTPKGYTSSSSKTWSHTGAKKYLSVRSAAQVTTSLGTVPNGCSAGRVTLGK